MKTIKQLFPFVILVVLLATSGCHFHFHVDDRHPFYGTFHARESFYNPHSLSYESYDYDIEVYASSGSQVDIVIDGYGSSGILGLNCPIIGEVYNGSHINIPVNVCYSGGDVFEVSGHGDLSFDGDRLTFDLDVVHCSGGQCHDEPVVEIDAYRL